MPRPARYTDPADRNSRLTRLADRGRRLYERIEAAAATIEAEWAEQVGAPRLEELRTTLSDLLTHHQGPAGKGAALNPARSCRNLGCTGRASFAAAPIISARSA